MVSEKFVSGIVSIIMPVFNIEKYLELTLDSIIQQDTKQWELILVDDGSTDNSGIICEKYAKLDNRIRVFHTVNQGVSHARNLGIANSTGEFIVFCDSDDLVAPNYISTMKEKIQETNADIVRCGRCFINEATSCYQSGNCSLPWILYSRESFADLHEFMYHVVWGKIFRKSLIVENGILFDEKLNRGEDTLFSYQTILCSHLIVYSDNEYVNYRIRRNSLMRLPESPSLYEQNVRVYNQLLKFNVGGTFNKDLKDKFLFISLNSIVGSLIESLKNKKKFISNYVEFCKDVYIRRTVVRVANRMTTRKKIAVYIMGIMHTPKTANIIWFLLKYLI